VEKAHQLHLLRGIRKLCGGGHPSLIPGRLRYTQEIKTKDPFWGGVDIPRVENSGACLIYQASILRLLNQKIRVVSVATLQFDITFLLIRDTIKAIVCTFGLDKIRVVIEVEILKEFCFFHPISFLIARIVPHG
jgi:hypothetical protein